MKDIRGLFVHEWAEANAAIGARAYGVARDREGIQCLQYHPLLKMAP